jgi:hypothetical protein
MRSVIVGSDPDPAADGSSEGFHGATLRAPNGLVAAAVVDRLDGVVARGTLVVDEHRVVPVPVEDHVFALLRDDQSVTEVTLSVRLHEDTTTVHV